MKEKFIARPGIPRAGWLFVDVLIKDTANFVCQNCNFPHVRYVHELKHKITEARVFVGCVCAEHLTQDFTNPKLREKSLRGPSYAMANTQLEMVEQGESLFEKAGNGDCIDPIWS